jgi:uncharacterized protein YbjT (DUF2867 family)
VFFMENLSTPWFLHGDQIISALAPTTSLQMVAVEDIGRVGARLFTDAGTMNGREVDLAGESATLPRVAEVFIRAMGRTVRYVQIPISEVRRNSEDFAAMLEWFESTGYDADIPGLEREFGKLSRIEDWAAQAIHAGAGVCGPRRGPATWPRWGCDWPRAT